MQKFGGEKALTKQLHEDQLKLHLEDAKIEVVPQLVDNTMVICGAHNPVVETQPKKLKVHVVKPKVTTKKSKLEKATSQLYDLESCSGPEKSLNLDLDLYQMEDY